ncbi:hypothetical protein THTE_1553 [Thermogutta terrifontis]|uniref:Uncharacterized protein n=1 Tax=Thermogutta terrifontis TaxID=1331910 RepID=A0A286RDW6_9BACT|nr:hypothetical protein THTE_1553 [Thermogutta terrifontis]
MEPRSPPQGRIASGEWRWANTNGKPQRGAGAATAAWQVANTKWR